MVRIGLIGFGQQGKLYASILSGTLPCDCNHYNCLLEQKIQEEAAQ